MSFKSTLRRCTMPGLMLLTGAFLVFGGAGDARAQTCSRTITANVVALDQVFFWNRLGAVEPQGMIYALRRDVVPINPSLGLVAGNVQLRADKRPRPIVLRMNVGDCLQISFQNLLNPTPVDGEQPATRTASIHVVGMQLRNSIADDGSNVGTNASSLATPGQTRTYTFYAQREGGYVLNSAAAMTGGEGDGGSGAAGLFGSVNVQAAGAKWYRSQVTKADMDLATTGTTPAGQPKINYAAVFPTGHPKAGQPILAMLSSTNEIIYTDINAVIAGSDPMSPTTQGHFPAGTFKPTPVNPNRDQPYREFTVIYSDEIGAVQAFPQFYDPVLKHTLHSVRDGFALNYGTGGVGAEILANRIGVGPMFDCTECKYEEFFLSSFTVGDPAMVVDVPANAPCTPASVRDGTCVPTVGPKATKAFYADDPSNVHHAYIRDHTRFRILHGGVKEHHIHHQHTHQWVHTPDSDNSSYLDSQALGPGSSFTLEITYHGGGNRNGAVGDSIFHCHFYPHFAQGMWELYRVHDVFERGTALDGNGRPAAGARALPDAEILAGTPIPALVPLPGLAMAPIPQAQASIVHGQVVVTGTGNPGYPFFIPNVAGHRPPHPPIDTIDDGGLPRHIISGGTTAHVETRLDFSKALLTADATAVPETGTAVELAAMAYHAIRNHPSFTPLGTSTLPNGQPANFITNGRPAAPGAPYADPCEDDNGNAAGVTRIYKAANIQFDIKLNKVGWHFPQQRIITLWDDVAPTLNATRPPEPFFFRANTNDCISFYQTNLVPFEYKLDDFQIRTPTDILGQHIHLVKFDVTGSDGSGNGWNYEDGTFSPDEVLERIEAINAFGGLKPFGGGTRTTLFPEPHPFFGTLGAQTTVQRWYADNTLNNAGKDRTLRTVFTHDHYGPSSHQQVGLYAGLVIEPQGSTWRHPETGVIFGSRFDGGPTNWRADILTANTADSYREFMFEFADFQHAYEAGGGGTAANPVPDPDKAINPPAKMEAGLPFLLKKMEVCPGGVPLPCPEAIAAAEVGTMVVNYRNEPIPFRIRDPQTNQQAGGGAGELSGVFLSRTDQGFTRADPRVNVQPNFYPPLTNAIAPTDPYTPLLRAYENDKIQVRMLVGATEEGHNFSVHGARWLFEPSDPNSGYRNNQMMGISEHFEFVIPRLAIPNPFDSSADFLYQPGSSVDDLWNGLWGIMRIYQGARADLKTLPNNPNGKAPTPTNASSFDSHGVCPNSAPDRFGDVTAVLAQNALPGGKLIYNPRTNLGGVNPPGPINDPTAILYFRTGDLDANGKLKAGVPIEPLVLRAAAGDCIHLTVRNRVDFPMPDLDGFNAMPMIVENFNANQVKPSRRVGLHAQLLHYDVSESDGADVGFNPIQTANVPGVGTPTFQDYTYYAGDVSLNSSNALVATPIEFGAINLIPADPIKHSNKGAIAALIIGPKGSSWVVDANSKASATVTLSNGTTFRDHTLFFQNDVNFRFGNGAPIPNLAGEDDPEDGAGMGFNYRTEPMWARLGFAPNTPLETTRTFDFTNALSNSQVGGDPVTPIFTAKAGQGVRFRVVMPGGHQRNNVFVVHGHAWQEEPFTNNSTVIGNNPLSEVKGAEMGIGPGYHFNAVPLNGAGGKFKIRGDYLYRTFQASQFDGGMWGIFRVTL
ncbi:MAG TPA: copper oxidase [Blastocatellia bacterium]|nr:copper oxidase [Blastocatellia bacterium]